jgi:hypothetical protein
MTVVHLQLTFTTAELTGACFLSICFRSLDVMSYALCCFEKMLLLCVTVCPLCATILSQSFECVCDMRRTFCKISLACSTFMRIVMASDEN